MYRVQLQEFEGPLDLLLYFIRRDELDIYDIPIARIADEFLEYVRVMEEVDLDGVGDFVYMAAVLINVKARMLLPSQEVDEEGEPLDPRRELVERLLEYVRFKEAADSLEAQHVDRTRLFTRQALSEEAAHYAQGNEVVLDVSVFDLVSALRRILTEAVEEPVHEVRSFEYTVEEQLEYLRKAVAGGATHSFLKLVRRRPRQYIIATFLACLELAREGRLVIEPTPGMLDFLLRYREETVAASGVQPPPNQEARHRRASENGG